MIELFLRKRIDILADAPLCGWLVETAADAGIEHHSLMPVHSGTGRSGSWRDDDGFGSVPKRMFIAVANQAKIDAFITALAPEIERYGLVISIYDVHVVRGERF